MNTVTVICKSKNRCRVYGSWQAALDSIRWWVLLDEVEREMTDLILGK